MIQVIDSVVIKQVYLGDGVTTHFPYPFSFIDADDVKVAIYDIPTEIETQLTSDYFVDTVAEEVIYPGYPPGEEPPESEQPPVLPDTQKLIVYRSTPLSQLEDLGEKYPLPIIEEMVDKVTMITQELAEKIGRAIVVEMGSSITPAEFLEAFREGVATAVEKAGEASASATAAGNSATAAGNSAAAAALSETAAGNSATAAYNSKVAAAASETAAGNSATAAGTSATNAGNSATAAGNSATAAHNSQVAAKASEDAAAQSAAEAAGINYLVRKNSTHYAEGVVAFYSTIPSPLVLECTTEGTTASTAPDFSGAVEGDTITDGTVVWTYKNILTDISACLTREITPSFNSRDVITTSGTYTAPVTGWYRIAVKGGGGGGGHGRSSSSAGERGGGGGGEGGTTIAFEKMAAGDTISVVVGAGGTGSTTVGVDGGAGGNSTATVNNNTYTGGGGTGGGQTTAGTGGTGTIPGCPGTCGGHATGEQTGASGGGTGGGIGGYYGVDGSNGTNGGGGGGGYGAYSGTVDISTNGGNGGDGFVWFEYFASI